MASQKILVTGATGFVGRALIARLLAEGRGSVLIHRSFIFWPMGHLSA